MNRLLLRGGASIPLSPKSFDTLAYLVQQSGRLVTRDELMKAIWPDSFVEDTNLTVNISVLRKALGELDDGTPYIETAPRKGYRFNAPVTIDAEPPGAPRPGPVILESPDRQTANLHTPAHEEMTRTALQNDDSASGQLVPAGGIGSEPTLPEVIPFPEPRRAPEAELTMQPGPAQGVEGSAAAPAAASFTRWWIVASLFLVITGVVAGWLLLRHPERIQQLVQRRLTSFAPEMAVTAAAISSGSKFIAYANPSGLFIQVITTGDTQPLLLPTAHFRVSSISWFPDSAELLVGGSSPEDATSTLWIVPAIGTGRPVELGPYPPGVVSPDGSEIAWINSRGATPEIQMMPSGGGPVRTLVTGASGEVFGGVSWSHSGRRVLFTRYSWDPQYRHNSGSIESYEIRSGKTVTVFSGRDFEGGVASLPDGRVLFSATLGANPSAYGGELLAVGTDSRTGVATSAPSLIAKWNAPVTDLTVSASGTQLALRDLVRQHNVYLGELNDGGTKLTGVRRFSFGVGCEDFPRAWTRDSRAIFLDSNRTGQWEIFKQALDSDSDEPFVQGPDDQFSPRVSPDGAGLLYIDRPRNWREPQPASLMQTPISGGAPQLVLKTSGFSGWGLRFECPQRAGLPCVLAQRVGGQIVFRSFDPKKGFQPGSKELAHTGYVPDSTFDWRLAPNGLSIAWVKTGATDNRIHLLPLARTASGLTSGGPERDIALSGGAHLHAIAWRQDGGGWFVNRQRPTDWTLLYASPEGGVSTLLTVHSTSAPGILPSPDGRYLAFSEQSFNSNVWLLKHF